ncbi:hypothetical protein CONLIGDRAFT_679724 [Coniochaeta ligniaria NRRL 30616]|uniref:Uncharacterized protein n=1 Tax=Coniochaeta ligniaria NRRL 30616 TaxID=1408157 RepID=A0A1J7ITG4_9PEZI|nr:hypothetical protein CONLIGDRAFT_679724 [Coniochaeta ligniaria NRRL 30616]
MSSLGTKLKDVAVRHAFAVLLPLREETGFAILATLDRLADQQQLLLDMAKPILMGHWDHASLALAVLGTAAAIPPRGALWILDWDSDKWTPPEDVKVMREVYDEDARIAIFPVNNGKRRSVLAFARASRIGSPAVGAKRNGLRDQLYALEELLAVRASLPAPVTPLAPGAATVLVVSPIVGRSSRDYEQAEHELDAAMTSADIELTPKKLKLATTKELERWKKQLEHERRERYLESSPPVPKSNTTLIDLFNDKIAPHKEEIIKMHEEQKERDDAKKVEEKKAKKDQDGSGGAASPDARSFS